MIDILKEAINLAKNKRQERADIRERAQIARAFNDRYTYRHKYAEDKNTLPGSFYGTPITGGNAWMCPECNKIHRSLECSVFDGLHYPSCCSTVEGNRLYGGIRTK